MSRAARAYASTQSHTGVEASDPGQLIVMVYERIFDHLKVGKLAMERGEPAIEPFTKAHDLIQQGLLACLDYETGGEVALSLGAVYEWALRELLSARLNKSPQKVQEILDVMTPLYDAWLALAPKEPVVSLGVAESDGRERSQAVNY